MGQAAAASAFLHVAIYSDDIISSIGGPGLTPKTKSQLKLYPNPAAPGELLNITAQGYKKVSQIKIYNQWGQELDCVEGTEVFDGRFRLNVKPGAGIYIVQMIAGTESFQTKLIIK